MEREATENSDGRSAVKTLGRRRPSRGGLEAMAPFLTLVVGLRGNRPFVPRGLYRFASFEEAQEWMSDMMTRPSRQGRRRSTTS